LPEELEEEEVIAGEDEPKLDQIEDAMLTCIAERKPEDWPPWTDFVQKAYDMDVNEGKSRVECRIN
jgi:hypothetical protein